MEERAILTAWQKYTDFRQAARAKRALPGSSHGIFYQAVRMNCILATHGESTTPAYDNIVWRTPKYANRLRKQ